MKCLVTNVNPSQTRKILKILKLAHTQNMFLIPVKNHKAVSAAQVYRVQSLKMLQKLKDFVPTLQLMALSYYIPVIL